MDRSVVFDLWQTLAVWPDERSSELRRAWSEELGVTVAALEEVWLEPSVHRLRETGPIAHAIAAVHERLGVEADVERLIAGRLEITRAALVPVEGALDTLDELRRRGIATGIVSNCTEEVAHAWEETPLAGRADVVVLSATAGCMKPEREIYELALARLGRDASGCLFVGDGANDELRGAEAAGMTPVLLAPNGGEPLWGSLRGWPGLRVTSIPEVLDLA